MSRTQNLVGPSFLELDVKARDAFGLPAAGEAEVKLKGCNEVLEGYADEVYTAVHASTGQLGENDG